jgi:NAD(P)-dependent dehydrogenase (short-subunit alcohol dehydrogenase family)
LSARADRIAFVTGAGKGLGRTTALALSAAGITVAAVGRTRSKLDATVARLPGRGIAVAADLTDPDQVRRAFQEVEDALGGVDILVSCAAEYSPFRIDEASDFQITNMVAQSLTSAIFLTREAVNRMRPRGGGDIVHISTQSAELPQPFMAVYGAAKAGVEVLCQGLRYELKGEDFRVVVCQVGGIADTEVEPGTTWETHAARLAESWERTGIGPMYPPPGIHSTGIAAAIVHAVTAPRDVHIHTIRLRGPDLDVRSGPIVP